MAFDADRVGMGRHRSLLSTQQDISVLRSMLVTLTGMVNQVLDKLDLTATEAGLMATQAELDAAIAKVGTDVTALVQAEQAKIQALIAGGAQPAVIAQASIDALNTIDTAVNAAVTAIPPAATATP